MFSYNVILAPLAKIAKMPEWAKYGWVSNGRLRVRSFVTISPGTPLSSFASSVLRTLCEAQLRSLEVS
jgi:hypothetical protein